MKRSFFESPIESFISMSANEIVGMMTRSHSQALEFEQTTAWRTQIHLLKALLAGLSAGHIFLEFVIPRMGKRADTILLVEGTIFVIEFKVGAKAFNSSDRRQTESYALDLKNFHVSSHDAVVVPILIATDAPDSVPAFTKHADNVYDVVCTNGKNLSSIVRSVLAHDAGRSIDPSDWSGGRYQPTPTIIEAAQALYASHSVENIARNDAGARNLAETSSRLTEIIHQSRIKQRKSICFVTGVPGSGKTLVGLNLATLDADQEQAVFLSGNGPLVEVLREALTRDEVARTPRATRDAASRRVKSFIQNVHHFRDEALQNSGPPHEHVVVFDEAQRAWDRANTSSFMKKKKGQIDFDQSEPEFLLNYMDRHADWCVVIALIGGGQEINTGEAGLSEWRDALSSKFPQWDVYFSDRINASEYAGAEVDFSDLVNPTLSAEAQLHLASSMRSFRAERLSTMIHHLVAGDAGQARAEFELFNTRYPIFVTRNVEMARSWVRNQARGTDSIGFVAASKAMRLKPYGVFVKSEPSIADWFLNPPEDIRSSNMLEEVATEFDVQGLELDWVVVGWDADYSFKDGRFQHRTFRGTRWQFIRQSQDQRYLENAYRVLLTRARQGMVIFVPDGSVTDGTRDPAWYDGTFNYLVSCGIPMLETDELGSTRLN